MKDIERHSKEIKKTVNRAINSLAASVRICREVSRTMPSQMGIFTQLPCNRENALCLQKDPTFQKSSRNRTEKSLFSGETLYGLDLLRMLY
jgi:hypothetical protein